MSEWRLGKLVTPKDDVAVYTVGICSCSVCVPIKMRRKEIERRVNIRQPTGISSSWTISNDPTFKGGQPNPCLCHDDEGRLHYLLHC